LDINFLGEQTGQVRTTSSLETLDMVEGEWVSSFDAYVQVDYNPVCLRQLKIR
jgi:hypothetical protein